MASANNYLNRPIMLHRRTSAAVHGVGRWRKHVVLFRPRGQKPKAFVFSRRSAA